MSDTLVARVAALYKAGSSTSGARKPSENVIPADVLRARQWQAELAKAMADLEQRGGRP